MLPQAPRPPARVTLDTLVVVRTVEQRLQLRVIRLLFPHRTRLLSSLANPHLLLTLSPNSRVVAIMVVLMILAILETSTVKAMTVGVDQ